MLFSQLAWLITQPALVRESFYFLPNYDVVNFASYWPLVPRSTMSPARITIILAETRAVVLWVLLTY